MAVAEAPIIQESRLLRPRTAQDRPLVARMLVLGLATVPPTRGPQNRGIPAPPATCGVGVDSVGASRGVFPCPLTSTSLHPLNNIPKTSRKRHDERVFKYARTSYDSSGHGENPAPIFENTLIQHFPRQQRRGVTALRL